MRLAYNIQQTRTFCKYNVRVYVENLNLIIFFIKNMVRTKSVDKRYLGVYKPYLLLLFLLECDQ